MEKRIAVRAVILDDDLNTAILSVRGGDFYKIPGGKVEEGENLDEALAREVLEETGCRIEVGEKIGEFEFGMPGGRTNYSICYLAQLIGKHGETNFSDFEKDNNFELMWLPFGEAVARFESCHPADEVENAINHRDLRFLESARSILIHRESQEHGDTTRVS